MSKIYPSGYNKKSDDSYNYLYGIVCGSCICIIIMFLIIMLIIIQKKEDDSDIN